MRAFLMMIASVVVLAASPATAGAASDQATKAKDAKAEKKICRFLETTGTRMAERVCLTAHEWKKVEQQVR